ncbi:MAG: hypothetical protein ACYDCC_05440 [Actinomycetota bacterium]
MKARLAALLEAPIQTVEDAERAADAARLLRDLMRIETQAEELLARPAKGSPSVVAEEAPAYGSASFEALPLHEAARRALEVAGLPLHVRDLGARIKAHGWRHPRTTRARSDLIEFQLAARLPRYPNVFRRVAPNTFGLIGWPEPPKDRPKPRLGTERGHGPPLSERIGDEPEMIFEEPRGPWRLS